MPAASQPTYDDAQLILKLYDLRREERLRKARAWFSSSFRVKMMDDFTRLCPVGSDENASYRMVVTYWEMVASFVTSGVLHKELFFQSGRELLFVWERIRDLVPGVRETTQRYDRRGRHRVGRARLHRVVGGPQPRRPRRLREARPGRIRSCAACIRHPKPPVSIRLIAIDIDGTLLDRHRQYPRREPPRHCGSARPRHRGRARHRVAASRFARPVAERLGLPVVLVASNGAIVRRLDGTTVLRRLMPQAVARDVLAADRAVPRRGGRRVRSSGGGSAGVGRARLDAPVARRLLRDATAR